MPKLIDYPRASFSRSRDLADAVDYLGGTCKIESCADKMGLKVSGGFHALIGAAKKHNLIDSAKDGLTTTTIYRNIKLAYNDQERLENLRNAFLAPPLYRRIYEKYKGLNLPVEMLGKLLIREFGIEQDVAPRIAGYFVEGARTIELLVDNKILNIDASSELATGAESETAAMSSEDQTFKGESSNIPTSESVSANAEQYSVHIVGPGMNSRLLLNEEEDFIILEAMIRKLKKKMEVA